MITNLRGDVVGICNANGVMVANYTYDAWGNVLSVTDQNGNEVTSAGHLGESGIEYEICISPTDKYKNLFSNEQCIYYKQS